MIHKDKQIVVLHIPKTAGTSLRKIIQQNYRPEELFFVYDKQDKFNSVDDLRNLSLEQKQQYKLFMGHLPFSQDFFSDIKPVYITFLRDPVERVISYYHHVMVNHSEWQNNNMSLLKYIEISNDLQLNNHQTRVISGMRGMPITEKHLEAAISNIENDFSFVGISERFDDSMQQIKDILGLTRYSPLRENVSFNRPDRFYFSELEVNKIKEINEFDMKLYEYVKSKIGEGGE